MSRPPRGKVRNLLRVPSGTDERKVLPTAFPPRTGARHEPPPRPFPRRPASRPGLRPRRPGCGGRLPAQRGRSGRRPHPAGLWQRGHPHQRRGGRRHPSQRAPGLEGRPAPRPGQLQGRLRGRGNRAGPGPEPGAGVGDDEQDPGGPGRTPRSGPPAPPAARAAASAPAQPGVVPLLRRDHGPLAAARFPLPPAGTGLPPREDQLGGHRAPRYPHPPSRRRRDFRGRKFRRCRRSSRG